jgi:hypothetical protein
MRFLMPAWAEMVAMAHTAPYDLMILAGTQSGKPPPWDPSLVARPPPRPWSPSRSMLRKPPAATSRQARQILFQTVCPLWGAVVCQCRD